MVEKYQHCNDKGFQGEQFVKKWFIDRWASEVDKKSPLKIYHGKWNNKKEAYINGSEEARWFFSVNSGTAIRKLGDSVDHNKCLLCRHNIKVDAFHVIYKCNGIYEFRMQQGLRKGVFFPSEIGLATGAEMNNETFKEWIVKNSHGIELNLGLLWMSLLLAYKGKINEKIKEGLVLSE